MQPLHYHSHNLGLYFDGTTAVSFRSSDKGEISSSASVGVNYTTRFTACTDDLTLAVPNALIHNKLKLVWCSIKVKINRADTLRYISCV